MGSKRQSTKQEITFKFEREKLYENSQNLGFKR